jgi:hypothetical protein
MTTHPRAKLGLAGRRALVAAIEGGMSLKARPPPSTSRRRRRTAGGTAGARRARTRRSESCLRDRSSRSRRQPLRLTAAQEEPILHARREPNLGPGRLAGLLRRARSTIWKGAPDVHVQQRAGPRPFIAAEALALPARPAREAVAVEPGALSPAEPPDHGRSPRPDPQPRRWLRLPARRRRRQLAPRLRRAAPPRGRGDERPHARARAGLVVRARPLPARGRDDRQRARLHPLAPLQRRSRRRRRPTHHDSPLDATLERQSRALHPNAPERVGLCAPLAELEPASQGPVIVRPLLQPPQTSLLATGPATHQPRSQRLWA